MKRYDFRARLCTDCMYGFQLVETLHAPVSRIFERCRDQPPFGSTFPKIVLVPHCKSGSTMAECRPMVSATGPLSYPRFLRALLPPEIIYQWTTLTQCWVDDGPTSQTAAHHLPSIGAKSRVSVAFQCTALIRHRCLLPHSLAPSRPDPAKFSFPRFREYPRLWQVFTDPYSLCSHPAGVNPYRRRTIAFLMPGQHCRRWPISEQTFTQRLTPGGKLVVNS